MDQGFDSWGGVRGGMGGGLEAVVVEMGGGWRKGGVVR